MISRSKSEDLQLTAQRKANNYDSPSTFMDGVQFAMENYRHLDTTIEDLKQTNKALMNTIARMQVESLSVKPKSDATIAVIVKHIIRLVAKEFNVAEGALASKRRFVHIVEARHTTWYLMRANCPGISYKYMGFLLGGFDHTTVLTGIRCMVKRIASDEMKKHQVQLLQNELNEATAEILNEKEVNTTQAAGITEAG